MSTGSRLKGGKVARNSPPSESDVPGSERINDNRTIASTLPPWRWGKARRLITLVPVSRISFTAAHQRSYHSHLCRAPPVSRPRAARLGCLEMSRKRAASQNTSQGAGGAPVKELVRGWCSVTQMCLTVSNSVDCGSPGSSAHGSFRQEYWRGLAFLTKGSNPRLLCLLHWQADSLPLTYLESPKELLNIIQLRISYLASSWHAELNIERAFRWSLCY